MCKDLKMWAILVGVLIVKAIEAFSQDNFVFTNNEFLKELGLFRVNHIEQIYDTLIPITYKIEQNYKIDLKPLEDIKDEINMIKKSCSHADQVLSVIGQTDHLIQDFVSSIQGSFLWDDQLLYEDCKVSLKNLDKRFKSCKLDEWVKNIYKNQGAAAHVMCLFTADHCAVKEGFKYNRQKFATLLKAKNGYCPSESVNNGMCVYRRPIDEETYVDLELGEKVNYINKMYKKCDDKTWKYSTNPIESLINSEYGGCYQIQVLTEDNRQDDTREEIILNIIMEVSNPRKFKCLKLGNLHDCLLEMGNSYKIHVTAISNEVQYWDASFACGIPVGSAIMKILGGECNEGIQGVKKSLKDAVNALKMEKSQLRILENQTQLLMKMNKINDRKIDGLSDTLNKTTQKLTSYIREISSQITSIVSKLETEQKCNEAITSVLVSNEMIRGSLTDIVQRWHTLEFNLNDLRLSLLGSSVEFNEEYSNYYTEIQDKIRDGIGNAYIHAADFVENQYSPLLINTKMEKHVNITIDDYVINIDWNLYVTGSAPLVSTIEYFVNNLYENVRMPDSKIASMSLAQLRIAGEKSGPEVIVKLESLKLETSVNNTHCICNNDDNKNIGVPANALTKDDFAPDSVKTYYCGHLIKFSDVYHLCQRSSLAKYDWEFKKPVPCLCSGNDLITYIGDSTFWIGTNHMSVKLPKDQSDMDSINIELGEIKNKAKTIKDTVSNRYVRFLPKNTVIKLGCNYHLLIWSFDEFMIELEKSDSVDPFLESISKLSLIYERKDIMDNMQIGNIRVDGGGKMISPDISCNWKLEYSHKFQPLKILSDETIKKQIRITDEQLEEIRNNGIELSKLTNKTNTLINSYEEEIDNILSNQTRQNELYKQTKSEYEDSFNKLKTRFNKNQILLQSDIDKLMKSIDEIKEGSAPLWLTIIACVALGGGVLGVLLGLFNLVKGETCEMGVLDYDTELWLSITRMCLIILLFMMILVYSAKANKIVKVAVGLTVASAAMPLRGAEAFELGKCQHDYTPTISCSFFARDSGGLSFNKVLNNLGIDYSIHGYWGNIKQAEPKLMKKDEFEIRFKEDFPEYIKYFRDSSPKTNFMCCNLQYHEYYCHGFNNGLEYEEWLNGIKSCLNTKSYNVIYPTQCRYDKISDCNMPEQFRNETPPKTVGCKKDKKMCWNPIGHGKSVYEDYDDDFGIWTVYEYGDDRTNYVDKISHILKDKCSSMKTCYSAMKNGKSVLISDVPCWRVKLKSYIELISFVLVVLLTWYNFVKVITPISKAATIAVSKALMNGVQALEDDIEEIKSEGDNEDIKQIEFKLETWILISAALLCFIILILVVAILIFICKRYKHNKIKQYYSLDLTKYNIKTCCQKDRTFFYLKIRGNKSSTSQFGPKSEDYKVLIGKDSRDSSTINELLGRVSSSYKEINDILMVTINTERLPTTWTSPDTFSYDNGHYTTILCIRKRCLKKGAKLYEVRGVDIKYYSKPNIRMQTFVFAGVNSNDGEIISTKPKIEIANVPERPKRIRENYQKKKPAPNEISRLTAAEKLKVKTLMQTMNKISSYTEDSSNTSNYAETLRYASDAGVL